MTLSLRDAHLDRQVRRLAARTGQSITQVVKLAVDQYEATLPRTTADERLEAIKRTMEKWKDLPVADPRSAKEIMDDLYDENGLPK